jgi:hypothetical protein
MTDIVTEDNREPIPDTDFYRRMNRGHRIRTGHDLEGYLVTEDGVSVLTRTCACSQRGY